MDLPELIGIDREIGLRALAERAAQRRFRPAAGALGRERRRGLRARARPLRARAARLPGRRRARRDRRRRRRQSAARAARGRGAAGAARVGGLPGAGGAVQARQEHRARADRPARARSRARSTEPAEAGAARGARRRAARGSKRRRRARDYRRALRPRSPACAPAVDRFFTEVFVMADDARLQDRAADADGGSARPDSVARGHFGNRFSDGVDVIDGKEARTHEVHRQAGRPSAAASKAATAQGRAEAGGREEPRRRRRGKYVYFFGRKTDGNGIDEAAARRQGREPRRDVPHRAAGASGLHHHHRGLHLLLRQQAHLSAGARSADGSRRRGARAADRQEVRRPEEPAARLGPLRRARLDAGHDGHDPQPRPERPDRRGAGDARPATPRFAWDCYRRFVQMYGDVVLGVQKRAGRGSRAVRDGDPRAQARALSPGHRGHEAHGRRPEGAGRPLQGAGQGARRQAVSRARRGISCWAPSARCSARG